MSTWPNLLAVHAERMNAWPKKFSDNAFRTSVLGSVQRRNATLDAVFYDVGCITEEELPSLAFWLAREGALLIVPQAGQGQLKVCLDKEDFLKKGGQKVKALAVAGVGSSALGAAAFARNIADALEGPVAAIVSGYGLSDAMTEALGGFFWFGTLNSVRHTFEGFDRITKLFTQSEPSIPESKRESEWTRLSKDTATLIDLLSDARFKTPYLVGHSKGNLVISEALYTLENRGDLDKLTKNTRIITISAKIGMPMSFKGRVVDIMGQWDTFGAMNSRSDIPTDLIVTGAWHSTNPDFPFGMGINVPSVLREALPLFDQTRIKSSHRPIFNKYKDIPQRAASFMCR